MHLPHHLEVLAVVGGAFVTTISLSSVLKYLFKNEKYPFPLFVTCMHMAVSYLVASIAINKLKMNEHTFRTFSPAIQMRKIFPIALCTAVSMGCSNLALKFLYPSFVSMVSSGLPLFTIVLALLLNTEKFNRWTYISMLPIFAGLAISSNNEVNFDGFGFIVLLIGIILRALKQVLQAKILRDEGKIDALTLLYYIAPQNFIIFFIWSLSAEGLEPGRVLLTARWQTWTVLIISTLFAAMFNLLSFRAITLINATAWSLMGLINAPAITILSSFLFGNYVAPLQMLGFSITLSGVYLYQQKGRVPNSSGHKDDAKSSIMQHEPIPAVKTPKLGRSVGSRSVDDDDFLLDLDDDKP